MSARESFLSSCRERARWTARAGGSPEAPLAHPVGNARPVDDRVDAVVGRRPLEHVGVVTPGKRDFPAQMSKQISTDRAKRGRSEGADRRGSAPQMGRVAQEALGPPSGVGSRGQASSKQTHGRGQSGPPLDGREGCFSQASGRLGLASLLCAAAGPKREASSGVASHGGSKQTKRQWPLGEPQTRGSREAHAPREAAVVRAPEVARCCQSEDDL